MGCDLKYRTILIDPVYPLITVARRSLLEVLGPALCGPPSGTVDPFRTEASLHSD